LYRSWFSVFAPAARSNSSLSLFSISWPFCADNAPVDLSFHPWIDLVAPIVVPFAAGGPADITGHIVADQFSRALGQQFVVENVTGTGGTTGTARAARANPGAAAARTRLDRDHFLFRSICAGSIRMPGSQRGLGRVR
jgi:hypothetical protein